MDYPFDHRCIKRYSLFNGESSDQMVNARWTERETTNGRRKVDGATKLFEWYWMFFFLLNCNIVAKQNLSVADYIIIVQKRFQNIYIGSLWMQFTSNLSHRMWLSVFSWTSWIESRNERKSMRNKCGFRMLFARMLQHFWAILFFHFAPFSPPDKDDRTVQRINLQPKKLKQRGKHCDSNAHRMPKQRIHILCVCVFQPVILSCLTCARHLVWIICLTDTWNDMTEHSTGFDNQRKTKFQV